MSREEYTDHEITNVRLGEIVEALHDIKRAIGEREAEAAKVATVEGNGHGIVPGMAVGGPTELGAVAGEIRHLWRCLVPSADDPPTNPHEAARQTLRAVLEREQRWNAAVAKLVIAANIEVDKDASPIEQVEAVSAALWRRVGA